MWVKLFGHCHTYRWFISHQGWFVSAGHYIFGCRFILFCVYCTCRYILAVVHFNANLHRDVKEHKKDKAERIKEMYPKFKNGEATICNVTIKQNFSKLKSTVPLVNIMPYLKNILLRVTMF